jgi:hypothetical protein
MPLDLLISKESSFDRRKKCWPLKKLLHKME